MSIITLHLNSRAFPRVHTQSLQKQDAERRPMLKAFSSYTFLTAKFNLPGLTDMRGTRPTLPLENRVISLIMHLEASTPTILLCRFILPRITDGLVRCPWLSAHQLLPLYLTSANKGYATTSSAHSLCFQNQFWSLCKTKGTITHKNTQRRKLHKNKGRIKLLKVYDTFSKLYILTVLS